ncbi:hypothetical protein R1sor_024426 [Riccia sorocarpa]|uniref:Uncharacterized protein n=1 Tax=Riccia sorocarpa TaxID=122646 RepID=A0ABD3GTP2_9MARC
MSPTAIAVWKDQIEKLTRWGEKNQKSDHLWRVRTWDEGGSVHAILECVECNSSQGKPQGSEDKMAVVNVFMNYRNKHLKSEKHKLNWCRRRGIDITTVPSVAKAEPVNHRAETDMAVRIKERLFDRLLRKERHTHLLHGAGGAGDQDPIHNGKKLVNPLDRSTHLLVLGEHHACLENVHLVCKLYSHDVHGLNLDAVIRRDRQNWAGPQRLCSRTVQTCLKQLEERPDEQRERTLGTRLYLEIVADYIDIFFYVKLDLKSMIILCGKVSFFPFVEAVAAPRQPRGFGAYTDTVGEKYGQLGMLA